MNKCFNFKFLILIIIPIIGVILSMLFLIFIPQKGLWLFLPIFILSFFRITFIVFTEPFFYIINKKEIQIICIFKKYSFLFDQIRHMELRFDATIDYLLIRDYVMILDTRVKMPERSRRIFKCKTTTKLIEEFYSSKIR